MLLTLKPTIDLTLLSNNALMLGQQLIDLAKDYQSRCIVMLDPFLSPIDDPVIDYFAAQKLIHQVKIMHPSVFAKKRPLLLELDLSDLFQQQVLIYTIDKALNQKSIEYQIYGEGQQFCAWLLSSSEVPQIANDLAKLALQRYLNKTVLLRFYDPAVFSQLVTLLTQPQQRKLYGQIDKWITLKNEKKLDIHSNQNQKTPVLSGALGLSLEQFALLYYIGINNQIIKSQRMYQPDIYINEVESLSLIMPCLQRLMNKGIKDEPLMVEWGTLALKYQPNFDLHPLVINATKNFKTRYDYYRWLKSMSEQDWHLITDIDNENNKHKLIGDPNGYSS